MWWAVAPFRRSKTPGRRVAVSCALLLTLSFSLSAAADTYPRQPAVDAIHYRFAIALSDRDARIEGEATETFRLTAPVDAIELDLIGAAGEQGMTVRHVTRQGEPVTFTHQANRLRLPVPASARPGDEVTYTISYGGTPADALPPLKNMHGEPVRFSEGWPNQARHWLPMIDHPYDKATGEMIVTAPAEWQVVSNGLLVEEVDLPNGLRRTHWKQSVPLASWLFAIGAARFESHHAGTVQGVPLQTWAFPQNAATARTVFEETSRRVLEFFTSRIGPYPYEKLANVQAAGYSGGMENATVIFYGEKGVASGRSPVAHEIAHQWFGNSVTESDWDDVWLSEGFATYFALLFREHNAGRDDFVEGLQRSRETVLQTSAKSPDMSVIHSNLSDMRRVLNPLVYQKGGWVLHMLRCEIGDELFWSGIREYYRRYRDRNATSDDFRQVMEQASGKDLKSFFAQWLTRGGNPAIATTWKYDATRRSIDVAIAQTQAGAPYALKVEVAIDTASGRRIETLVVDAASTSKTMTVDGEPLGLVVDPNTSLLATIVPVRRIN
jgi:aminopeptidase N